jgi:hypothetical protein
LAESGGRGLAAWGLAAGRRLFGRIHDGKSDLGCKSCSSERGQITLTIFSDQFGIGSVRTESSSASVDLRCDQLRFAITDFCEEALTKTPLDPCLDQLAMDLESGLPPSSEPTNQSSSVGGIIEQPKFDAVIHDVVDDGGRILGASTVVSRASSCASAQDSPQPSDAGRIPAQVPCRGSFKIGLRDGRGGFLLSPPPAHWLGLSIFIDSFGHGPSGTRREFLAGDCKMQVREVFVHA